MPNRLANETSPYLQQHADNPVDWYPWGDEALARAREEDRPMLLSIGYSACHWCHVMAHECFEDEAVAGLMNKLFVNIKVDREERPDLDKIYQTAHHLLTRNNGGWPLTMFLTPDQTPFFGGTYFPKLPKHGLPGFPGLLERVAAYYAENRAAIDEQNQALLSSLAEILGGAANDTAPLTSAPLNAARDQAGYSFDQVHGGFGAAPKFPHPTNIERLLRHYAATRDQGTVDQGALDMAASTLRRMAEGGIYDQLGGGFCRYSVDAQWMIPHFEKMLYDNGPLLALYAEAWQVSADPLFRKTALDTADWSLRDMQSPEGGFYSSLDADSEGQEGKFYAWSRSEVQTVLGDQVYAVFARRLGLDGRPNFEGRWHLHVSASLGDVAAEFEMTVAQVEATLAAAREQLLAVRNRRVWPGRDEKVLTAWNALMIKGLAVAGRVLERPDYLQAAGRALDFIRTTLWQEGRLLATYKDGRAHLNAYLDDYALLIDAILSLLHGRWRSGELDFAVELAEVLLSQFQDEQQGGFWFTSHDHERLIQRTKSWYDDALPAGNGIAAYCLNRLGHLLGETRYLEAAARTVQAAWSSIEQAPSGHNALLLALEEILLPTEIVVIRGQDPQRSDWYREAVRAYAPRRWVVAIDNAEQSLPGLLTERAPHNGCIAYVCQGQTCQAPITDPAAFAARMQIPQPAEA